MAIRQINNTGMLVGRTVYRQAMYIVRAVDDYTERQRRRHGCQPYGVDSLILKVRYFDNVRVKGHFHYRCAALR